MFLDQSIIEHESMTFGQLMRKSHDAAWDEANRREHSTNVISPISMAKVMNADEAMLGILKSRCKLKRHSDDENFRCSQ